MTAFFSTAFINALSATPGMINGSVVKCVLFREAPAFAPNDSRYIGKTTVSQLLSMPGWIPVSSGGAPLANTITVGVRDEGKSNYVMFSSFPFTGLAPNEAKAAVFLRADDTIIFGTNTPFAGEMRIVKDGDAITASPDSTLVGASNRWLFNWADAPQAGGTIVTISEGPLLLSLGPPDFEPAHTQHVWLYPQRANMIANPSFEKSSPPTAYWSSNGTVTRVALVNPPISAGRFAGRFEYGGGIVVAESNTFPTMREEYWTIQFMARGLGDMKVGFVYWDDDFEAVSVDWGNETWQLDPNTFIHISVCRFPVQTYQAMLRIEATGGDLTIDQVLCEVGFLKDWPYFDGDTDFGMREDFTWYGGEVRQGGSYSLWYNHKRAVFGRMFAREVADDELVTDEVVAAQGISYGWVPAGTNVTPHMDVLYPHDLQLVVPDKPASVLSYRVTEDGDPQGVVYPWGLYVYPGLHAHSADHVTLQVYLQVQNGVHAHTAANVVIVAVPNTAMVPANAAHAHTAAERHDHSDRCFATRLRCPFDHLHRGRPLRPGGATTPRPDWSGRMVGRRRQLVVRLPWRQPDLQVVRQVGTQPQPPQPVFGSITDTWRKQERSANRGWQRHPVSQLHRTHRPQRRDGHTVRGCCRERQPRVERWTVHRLPVGNERPRRCWRVRLGDRNRVQHHAGGPGGWWYGFDQRYRPCTVGDLQVGA